MARETTRSIIIHHIEEWSVSKSNEESNLVVLCLMHHDEAHSTKQLSQNLTPERIKAAKDKWEKGSFSAGQKNT
ncbi:MAG: HNH endonuclease [Saprospiraceae bacterium]|nr:HNH endonuclease [Saprospiraceae bacterium]